VAENNRKLFEGEVTVYDLRGVITREEMTKLAGMLRHMVEKTAAMTMERSPLPQGIRTESVDCGGVPAEWLTVPRSSEKKVLMYLHGGGWVLGSPYVFRPLTSAFGEATGLPVLAVDYRLSPEYPFPAALEDCVRAYRWLVDQGFDASDVVIAGDSAGGNLTLATMLKLRDLKIPLPKRAVCLSPATSFEFEPSVFTRGKNDPILADAGIFWWIFAYMGTENPADPQNPYLSPLLADLTGLPPLLVQATPVEMLFEYVQRFVEKARTSGVDVTFQTWDRMVHVWQLFFLGVFPEAREAVEKAAEWVMKN
jgi:acetyl esterase/lipase